MLLALFLAITQTATDTGANLSPALRRLVETRAALPADEFVRQVEALALAGDASAAEMAGEGRQFGGLGWTVDMPKACDWFERAAATRGDSAHNLALCHETGRGRAQDAARARLLYTRAIGLGWIQAKCALGTMLVSGSGGPADIGRGLSLCREAAEAGNANAQTDYGTYLLLGKALPQDMVAARRWFAAAASQNQANAAMLLGPMLWNGDGGAADPEAAAGWFKVAYDGGRRDAAAFLARAAFKRVAPDGKVVDRGALPDAIHWLRIAAEEDPDPAKRADFAETLKDLGAEK